MQNRTGVIVLTSIFVVLCLFKLSFTFVARQEANKATEYAKDANGQINLGKKQQYLDQIYDSVVYDYLGLKYTYKEVKETELSLGLDLQGGMHVTLEVSPVEILNSLAGTNKNNKSFQQALSEASTKIKSSRKSFTALFLSSYKDIEGSEKLNLVFSNAQNRSRGIDSRSSDSDIEKIITAEVDEAVTRAEQIIRNRIDKFGAIQPNIQILKNSGRIQVELPGVENPQRVRNLLQGAAKLEFVEVYSLYEIGNSLTAINNYLLTVEKTTKASDKSPLDASAAAKLLSGDSSEVAKTDTVSTQTDSTAVAKADTTAPKSSSFFSLLKSNGYSLNYLEKDTAKINRILNMEKVKSLLPSNLKFIWAQRSDQEKLDKAAIELLPLKKSRTGLSLGGEVITNARADVSQDGKNFEISMQMNAEGAKKWKKMTAAASADPKDKKRIAIVLDDYAVSAPTVQNEIPNGSSSITGNFTYEEAKDLASKLKAGKMPAPVRIVEEAVVGPSLGKESINKGLLSILASFIFVVIFMIAIYNRAGWVADLAVIVNFILLLGILASLNAALTLPGIAGIVLTLGMAVDANVLINERVKEELAMGRTIREAITNGYKNAFSAIFDSNLTTMIAGIVLLIFGSGLIYGFAVTLIIGIVSSFYTALAVTRVVFETSLNKNKNISFSNATTKNLLRSTNIDFIGKRKLYYAFSGIVIIAGIISISIKGFNYGVDFKGGRSFVVQFENTVSADEIRTNLAGQFGVAPEVKTYGSDDKFKITTAFLVEDDSEEAALKVESKLNEGLSKFANNKTEVLSTAKVGPTIANDIKTSAIWGIIVAVICMFIYILIRFKKIEFALGAVISLAHDVLFVLALFTLLQDIVPFTLEIDQAFIAAILTVIGYSINDSVVVFDRVREFLADNKSGKDAGSIINHALNDTLSRTLITGMTTIFGIFILFLFGGEALKTFSFAMLTGVIVGTYSSICIGAPIVLDLGGKRLIEQTPTNVEPVLVSKK
ncbi:MAG: protein translocase subunit SecDF [Cytophagales bacterium]|nr:MAG: protein translocase subunit SecDF [Cytophagales bacterium]